MGFTIGPKAHSEESRRIAGLPASAEGNRKTTLRFGCNRLDVLKLLYGPLFFKMRESAAQWSAGDLNHSGERAIHLQN